MRRPPLHDPSAPRAKVSAAIFLDQKKLLEELFGRDAVQRAVASLAPAHRQEIEELLPVSWLGLEACTAFHYAIAAEAEEEPVALHRRVTRLGMERTFSGIWRFFARFTSVDAIAKRAATVYARSYDTGKMSARVAGPGLVELEVTEWPHMPELEIDAIASGLEAVLHLSGRNSASVLATRRADGAIFVVRFER